MSPRLSSDLTSAKMSADGSSLAEMPGNARRLTRYFRRNVEFCLRSSTGRARSAFYSYAEPTSRRGSQMHALPALQGRHAGRAGRGAGPRPLHAGRRAAGRQGRPRRQAVRRPGRRGARSRPEGRRHPARGNLRHQRGEALQVRDARQAPLCTSVPTPTRSNAASGGTISRREIVKPEVVVALGATAGHSLTGRTVTISRMHLERHAARRRLVITIHPSALLRGGDGDAKRRTRTGSS